MRVVIFAHTPPPHHGQSHMVELMLRGFSDPARGVECFHVNARFAADMEDIGKFRAGKAFRLLKYCGQAVWHRFRHKARTLYYIPAPALKNVLIRDWVILLLCKPFFHHVILHWHAAGLGEWIAKQPVWMQRVSRLALGHADLAITPAEFNQPDAGRFSPQRSMVIPNGVPDPCPDFETVHQARHARLERRRDAWNAPPPEDPAAPATPVVIVRVLFLGLGMKEKGLLDAIDGVAQANGLCAANRLPIRFELTVAGKFLDPENERLYNECLARLGQPAFIKHAGFVAGADKARLLAETDLLCFPSYYFAESFGLVVAEAMAFGMPIVTTRWRSIPEFFAPDYPGLVDTEAPDQVAAALISLATRDDAAEFRGKFLAHYTLERHLDALARAFRETAAA